MGKYKLLDKVKNREADVLEAYKITDNLNEIYKTLGVSPRSIKKILANNDIIHKGMKARGVFYRKYSVNNDYFSNIDTEEKAYWLGFIAADGYVNLKTNTLSITLSKTDEQTLHQFKKSINANNPIHQYRKITPHGKTVYQCNISIRSKKLISDLYKLNVVQNKSLVLKPSTDISDELIIHYIRGYYDGDGGIAQHRVKKRNNILQTNLNFTGTKEMLNYIDEYLYSKSKIKPIMYKRFKDDKNTHTLMYNGNITVIRIAEILYKSATVYMQRKYDLYKELFSLYDQNHQGFYVNRTRNMKKWYYDFRVSGKRTAKYGFTCFIDAYNDCLRALYNCGASPAIIEKFIVMNCNRLRVEQG